MTTDNDTIRQLLELMKALKCDQSTASAIQGLTARVANLEAIASRTGSTNRTHGYVNWNNTHDILKTKQWKKLSEFTNFCGSLERDAIPKFYVCVKMNIKNIVNEETRFPQDELYVNVANPLVRAEVLHINEVTKPTAGLVERFLNIAKEDMHTRSSFEQKYKLNWVEPLKK